MKDLSWAEARIVGLSSGDERKGGIPRMWS